MLLGGSQSALQTRVTGRTASAHGAVDGAAAGAARDIPKDLARARGKPTTGHAAPKTVRSDKCGIFILISGIGVNHRHILPPIALVLAALGSRTGQTRVDAPQACMTGLQHCYECSILSDSELVAYLNYLPSFTYLPSRKVIHRLITG